MDETQDRRSRVGAIGLEYPYRLPLCTVDLAKVCDDHAYIMTAARERPAEQRLLDRFAADRMLPVFRRQDRQIVQTDQADSHLASLIAHHETMGEAACRPLVRLAYGADTPCRSTDRKTVLSQGNRA